MGTFATETIIRAAVDEVWRALGQIGDIYRWNPGVKASHTTSEVEDGLGATRFCDLGGGNYLDEAVVAWQPHEKLTMRIMGTNLPFETADVRFTLRPISAGTVVSVSPLYKLKYGPLGVLLDKVYVQKSYQKGMESLLAGLKNYVEGELVEN